MIKIPGFRPPYRLFGWLRGFPNWLRHLFEALPAGSEALSNDSEALPAGSKALSVPFEVLPAPLEAFQDSSMPEPSQLPPWTS